MKRIVKGEVLGRNKKELDNLDIGLRIREILSLYPLRIRKHSIVTIPNLGKSILSF